MSATPTDTSLALEQIATDYFAAWSARDVDRILSMHTEDTRFEIHAGGGPAVGREAVREAFAEIFEQWPKFRFESRRVLFGPRHWTLDWTLISENSQGGEIKFDCIDLVEVADDGRVARKDTFVDPAQLQAALGGAA